MECFFYSIFKNKNQRNSGQKFFHQKRPDDWIMELPVQSFFPPKILIMGLNFLCIKLKINLKIFAINQPFFCWQNNSKKAKELFIEFIYLNIDSQTHTHTHNDNEIIGFSWNSVKSKW